jgi:midasin (ATPase involved in ribosome maturation)
MADFKSLRGNRLLLDLPKKEEGKLIVDENTKEALEREMVQKYNKLVVYSVGDLITDIKVGDEVLVDPAALGKAPVIPIGDDNKLLVSPFDVILIW